MRTPIKIPSPLDRVVINQPCLCLRGRKGAFSKGKRYHVNYIYMGARSLKVQVVDDNAKPVEAPAKWFEPPEDQPVEAPVNWFGPAEDHANQSK